MSTNRIVRSVAFEPCVFEAIERLRGTRQQFRSELVNAVLKEKLLIN